MLVEEGKRRRRKNEVVAVEEEEDLYMYDAPCRTEKEDAGILRRNS